MNALKPLLTVLVVAGIAFALFVWSGVYNVAADAAHYRGTHWLLETMRDRSIDRHAAGITVPKLDDAAMVRRGAGNYASMCVDCHLAPGMDATELSKGLYPAPPNFSQTPMDDPAGAFWVVKHGIKASAMAAWGKSMDDTSIWDVIALLQKLPQMTPESYRAEVAASGGHSHGGGESDDHHDDHDHGE